MGSFGRKILKKIALPRLAANVDRKVLKSMGLVPVPEDTLGLSEYPPLSEQLRAMATPILDRYSDAPAHGLSSILGVIVMCWNAAYIISLTTAQVNVEQLVETMLDPGLRQETPQDRASMIKMCCSLVRMRLEFFAHDPRLIENFSIKRLPDGYEIKASGVAVFRHS